MAIPARPQPDELISSQQLLLAQIKKSHRLFVIRFGVLLFVSILVFCWIAHLFFLEDEDSLTTFFILEAFPIIIMVRSFKENWIFLKWSGPYLKAIEESGKHSPILTGLTTYVNRLYQAAFLDTFSGRERQDLTPAQFVEEIRRRSKLKLVIAGVVIVLIVAIVLFLLLSGAIDIPRAIALGSPLLGIAGVAVVMTIFQTMWMRSLKQWAHAFLELDAWGKHLERTFLKSQVEGKGGS